MDNVLVLEIAVKKPVVERMEPWSESLLRERRTDVEMSAAFTAQGSRSRARHTRRTWVCSQSSKRLVPATTRWPRSVAAVEDARTGAVVYIVGVVHGFQSTCRDLDVVFTDIPSPPQTVLLELCDRRWRELTREERRREKGKEHRAIGLRAFRDNLRIAEGVLGGKGPALLGTFLASISSMQKLAGFRPGVEFTVAADRAKEAGASIVLGDRSAAETINRFYNALNPMNALRTPTETYGRLIPRIPPANGVNLLRALLEPERLREMMVLLVPTTVASMASLVTLSEAIKFLLTLLPVAAADNVAALSSGGEDVVSYLSLVFMATWTSSFLKVIVDERDRYLFNSFAKVLDDIDAMPGQGSGQKSIVGVVGIFHVNGLVRHFNERNEEYRRHGMTAQDSSSALDS